MTSGRHLFPLCLSVLGSFWYVFESIFFPRRRDRAEINSNGSDDPFYALQQDHQVCILQLYTKQA